MANSLPVNMLVDGRRCVVVGAGAVALGKIEALVSRGADVRVVAPEAIAGVERLAADGRITLERRGYREGDLTDAVLAVGATGLPDVDERVFREALERGVPVNVVDDIARCTVIFPAVVRRGDLQIAISTDGRSPAVAVRVKQRLEAEFGAEYAELLEILGEARPSLAGWRTQAERAAVWFELVDAGLLDMIREGRGDEARALVRERIDALRHDG